MPSRSLKLADIAGRSRVPATRAWPVTGSRLRHMAVVSVQPIRRICRRAASSSTFWPTPVVRAWVERGERAAEGEDGAGLVGNGDDAGLHGLARRRVGLGDAAERLRHGVGARQVRVRPLRAVARDRDVDELRVDLAQLLVTEAVLLGGAGAEVLAEDVGAGDELAQDLAPSGAFRFSVTLFTPRLLVSKNVLGMPGSTDATRELSPPPGTSILITSAPRSAISM